MLHGAGILWYIYLHNWVIFRANVGKYSIHGAYGYDYFGGNSHPKSRLGGRGLLDWFGQQVQELRRIQGASRWVAQ